ncbi:MAG: four helix bundle protein [Fibrobacter sp.]|nr:four helix bundle protein [Fibrobacter sp.]
MSTNFGTFSKEAGETEYWLELLHDAQYLESTEFENVIEHCQTIVRMLNAITKTARNR